MGLTAATALVLVVSAAPAAPALACDDTITQNTTLMTNLFCPSSDGINIGADGITLNLNGHTIDGGSAANGNSGVDNGDGYNGVTIKNGKIKNFQYGVYMFGDGGTVTGIKTLSEGVQDGEGIESSGTGNTFSKNIFDNASFGIYLYSSEGDTVAYNIVKNSATGYYTDGVLNTTFIGNMANRNEYGYYIDGGGADLVTMIENTATGNLNNGFFVSMAYNGSDGSVFRNNTAKGNGTGTGSPGFHDEGSRNAVWRGNAAKANGDDGFELLNPRNVTFTNNRANRNAATGANFVDNDPGAGDNLADVSRNTATGNGSYGFYADFPAPGSDNKAKKNAAGNCFNVNC